MRILIVHNHYQNPGGEDAVVASEATLLRHFGHEVMQYEENNSALGNMNRLEQMACAIWSRRSEKRFGEVLRSYRPHVVHFHNTFVMISPSAYYVAQRQGVPVVQTLHNYRLLCTNGMFFRNGGVCEDCLNKSVPWPSLLHACYRDSRVATGVVALMLSVHRSLGTWNRTVDVYIALTEFARAKFIQGGLPAEKIVVKPNFIFPDPISVKVTGEEEYALFVGRLSPEKGIDTMLAAWTKLDKAIPLKVVGDGPMADFVRARSQELRNVDWLGPKATSDVYKLMRGAKLLIFPSKVYEGLSRTLIEAYALGTPVIASNLGSMSAVVKPYQTGLLFDAGDSEMLARQVEWALMHTAELKKMRKMARAEFETKYTAERNYQMLMAIYQRAMTNHRPHANNLKTIQVQDGVRIF